MKGESRKEDSDSEWDSSSEMQQSPLSDSTRSKGDFNVRSQQRLDNEHDQQNPPYSFKSETNEAPAPSDPPKPPGKSRKGRVYDPPSITSPKQPKSIFLQPSHKNSVKLSGVERTSKHLGVEVLPSLKVPQSVTKAAENGFETYHDGIGNKGFEDDDDEANGKEPKHISNFWKKNVSFDTKCAEKESRRECRPFPDSKRRNNCRDIQEIQESTTRLQASLSEPSDRPFQPSLRAIDAFFQKAFRIAALPFTIFFIFFHNCIKFVLDDILGPLVLDFIYLISTYFLEPLLDLLLKPLFYGLFVSVDSISRCLILFLRPIVQVVQAFRCVEVNIGRRIHEV